MSHGLGCGRSSKLGVYTKVYHYLSWIESVTSKVNVSPNSSTCQGRRCPLGECLPKARLCDGLFECSDGSDERNCT